MPFALSRRKKHNVEVELPRTRLLTPEKSAAGGRGRDADASKERRRFRHRHPQRRRVLVVCLVLLLLVGFHLYRQRSITSASNVNGFAGSVSSILLLLGAGAGAGSMAATTTGPSIVFSRRAFGGQRRRSLVTPAGTPPLREPMYPDYGDLEMFTLHHTAGYPDTDTAIKNTDMNMKDYIRVIAWDDYEILHEDRLQYLEDIDDDDVTKSYEHKGELVEYPGDCLRNNWGWTPKPVCNNLHEVSIDPVLQQAYDIRYLSHGYYRDTWLLDPRRPELVGREFILKTLRLIEDHEFDYWNLRKVEKEAIIMEGLSASKLIVDIYGHCGTSIMAEAMPGEITTSIVPAPGGDIDDYDRGHIHQSELDVWQSTDVQPMNNLTVKEKIDLALLMAESMAELHGFKGGVIVHGDVHPDQWLKAADGSIKLNDFNNGHMLGWSQENQTYCDYQSNYGGAYKAPEEFDEDLYNNEGVDTWAIGHGIYGLLTGLFPYYRTFSHTTIRQMVVEGKKPFVDDRYRTRSWVEGRLVEIMKQCWEYEAADRPSIFDVVRHIRETKRLYSVQNQKALTGIVNHTKTNISLPTPNDLSKRVQNKNQEAFEEHHNPTSVELLERLTSGVAKPKTQRWTNTKIPGLKQ